MKNKKGIISFSDTTKDIVEELNKKLLIEGKISTKPYWFKLICYDSFNIETNKTPDDSIARRTIECLRHVFPYIKIELGEKFEIIVEDKLLNNYSALIDIEQFNHDDYIKEIMIEIFSMYDQDEQKIPRTKMYDWYFNPDKDER